MPSTTPVPSRGPRPPTPARRRRPCPSCRGGGVEPDCVGHRVAGGLLFCECSGCGGTGGLTEGSLSARPARPAGGPAVAVTISAPLARWHAIADELARADPVLARQVRRQAEARATAHGPARVVLAFPGPTAEAVRAAALAVADGAEAAEAVAAAEAIVAAHQRRRA